MHYGTEIPEGKDLIAKLTGGKVDDIEKNDINYFWLTSNPKQWKVSSIFEGGEIDYTAINKKGNKRRIYTAFELTKPGDRIVFYESTPTKKILGVGTITKGLFKGEEPGYPDIVEKIRIKFDARISELTWDELVSIPALGESEPIKNGAQGSLFHLTKEEFDIITTQSDEEPLELLYPYDELDVNKLRDLRMPFKVKNLYFENPEIIEDQIIKSLSSGKHLILIGPPGTGKSKLAKEICEHYVDINYILSTASSDWSTFDTIGGYIPDEKGNLSFNPGIFLKCLQDKFDNASNCWLIIDEINRADIDKAFGALFSSLTGDSVTLSYSRFGNQVQIIGDPTPADFVESHKYYIHPDWRIIATMNTFDKASLYEMSYAFMRRFAYIPIDVPSKISDDLIKKYLEKWKLKPDQNASNIATLWEIINGYRKIGPAIVHDMYLYLQSGGAMDSCIILYVLPQFEGIEEEQQINFIKTMSEQLESAGKKRLISFASDFFDIDMNKF